MAIDYRYVPPKPEDDGKLTLWQISERNILKAALKANKGRLSHTALALGLALNTICIAEQKVENPQQEFGAVFNGV